MNPKLAFQVSPIWFTGPPVSSMPNQTLPIIAITDIELYKQAATGIVTAIGHGGIGSDANAGTTTATAQINLDDAFGAFTVLPGGSLAKQEVAQYPFANQMVAGNATIFSPLDVSLIWDTPMRGNDAWNKRLSVMTQLQAFITYHNNHGGTYTITTPSFIYTNMLLTSLADASRGQNPIPQNAWKFDFTKPLISITDLTAAQNAMMSKITAGLATNGDWTGLAAGLGQPNTLPQFTLPGFLSPVAGPGGNPVPSAVPQ